MKNLKNILINTVGNKLRLAEVHFTNTIEEIKFLSNEIDWKEIDTKVKLSQFFNKVNVDDVHLLMPGAIDPHVHFDTPGFEFREDFEHASTAGAFGGVTTIIDMPCTSIPPVINKENLNVKLDAVKNKSLIDFAFWGGIRRQDFDDIKKLENQVLELSEAGVAGYKVYVISGMSDFADLTYKQIKTAADIVKQTGKPLAVHAEDKLLVTSRREKFQKENKISWKEYCSARDDEAEKIAVERIKEIAKETGCRIHIVHLSSKQGVNILRNAQAEKLNLTGETCPHYLYFTQKDYENEKIRNYLKTAPPIKNKDDKEALWDGLKNNELEFVTTDHAGCNPKEEKTSNNFWEVYGGIPGVEHRVPFLLSEGFLKNKLTLEQTINLLSTNAANYFNLISKGKLEVGKDADFALIDLWNSKKIRSDDMHSKGKYTPMEGVELNCIVNRTILRGEDIMNRHYDTIGNIGFGRFIAINT